MALTYSRLSASLYSIYSSTGLSVSGVGISTISIFSLSSLIYTVPTGKIAKVQVLNYRRVFEFDYLIALAYAGGSGASISYFNSGGIIGARNGNSLFSGEGYAINASPIAYNKRHVNTTFSTDAFTGKTAVAASSYTQTGTGSPQSNYNSLGIITGAAVGSNNLINTFYLTEGQQLTTSFSAFISFTTTTTLSQLMIRSEFFYNLLVIEDDVS